MGEKSQFGNQTVYYARMYSTMGRNNLFCYDRFQPASNLWVECPCLGPCEIHGIVMCKVEDATYLCAQSLHELILVRDDYLCVPGSGLNRADIDAMIYALCTD
jgi:hypothetical protein